MEINLSFLEFDISKLIFKGHLHINVQLFGLLLSSLIQITIHLGFPYSLRITPKRDDNLKGDCNR